MSIILAFYKNERKGKENFHFPKFYQVGLEKVLPKKQ